MAQKEKTPELTGAFDMAKNQILAKKGTRKLLSQLSFFWCLISLLHK